MPTANPNLRLEPVTLADRAVVADIISRANFDDPYGQCVWPSSTLDFRYAGSYARLPMSLLSEGNWFMKCVLSCSPASPSAGLEERKTVAYAQYRLPSPLWENVRAENGGGIQAEVTEEMKEEFAREYAESCTAGGEPRGMRVEVVESCGPAMREANRRCFPGDRESYISALIRYDRVALVQVNTLPAYQRRGAGTLLTRWGNELADREGLKVCLESTGFGRKLYDGCGFAARKEVKCDVSRFGGPAEYAWTMMVREPRGGGQEEDKR